MTVKVSKPPLNLREELSALNKPTGIAGEAMLRAKTVAEQQALMNHNGRHTGTTTMDGLVVGDGIYLGGTGAANKLDDYEEGTWTSLNEVTGGNCTNIAHSDSYYTKVGRLVTLSFKVAGAITSASAETNFKFNLPFAAINSSNQGAGGTANLFIGSGSDRFGVGSVFNGTTSNVTSHIYIPSSETSDNGTFSDMRVFMSYITP